MSGGYGWVVPKEDHINVGVGGWEREGPRLRDRLACLCAAHRFPAELRDVRGHRLPMCMPSASLARGRALLVGDAAGLVDPLTGDGIYEAFLSPLAAEATLELLAGRTRGLEPYGAALSRELDPLHSTARRARLALDRTDRSPRSERLRAGDLVPVALVLFVPAPFVLVALVLGVAALTLRLLSRLLGTLHVATMAGMLGIATFLAPTA